LLKISLSNLLVQSSAGQYAPGFGIGALEELDVEDEDIYASGNLVILFFKTE
jgi:G patch domain-containing protein 1